MRTRFLQQYALSCHTKQAAVAESVKEIQTLALVLQAYKPARELLMIRLEAAKSFTAQLFSGTHRLGRITASADKTLMQMRIDIFNEQRRSGATAKNLVGHSDFVPQLRVFMKKGRYTLEYRRVPAI